MSAFNAFSSILSLSCISIARLVLPSRLELIGTGQYDNLSISSGSAFIQITGGNYGSGYITNGQNVINNARYGINIAGNNDHISITGTNLSDNYANGSCTIGGAQVTGGGLNCGLLANSAAANNSYSGTNSAQFQTCSVSKGVGLQKISGGSVGACAVAACADGDSLDANACSSPETLPPPSPLTAINAQSEYGVKCDGITDDTAALQNAITAAGTGSHPIVMMPAGTCLISSQLQFLQNSVRWVGQGGNSHATNILSSFQGDVINVGSVSSNPVGVQIKGILFTSSMNRTSGAAIHRFGASNSIFEDLQVYNMYTGIQVEAICASGRGSCGSNNVIQYSSIGHNSNAGIILGTASSTTLNAFPQNEFIINSDVSQNATGIMAMNCGNCNLLDVQGILNGIGLLINPGSGQSVSASYASS